AEDGIRDDLVTGVQTCALPICGISHPRMLTTTTEPISNIGADRPRMCASVSSMARRVAPPRGALGFAALQHRRRAPAEAELAARSEERRVGKRVEMGGGKCRER